MRMMMKMASVALLLLLPCSFIVTASTKASAADCKYAAVGQDITVLFDHKLLDKQSLKWKHDANTIFHYKNKTVVFVRTDTGVEKDGVSLKLKNLKKNDAGTYTADVIHEVTGKQLKTLDAFKLCVEDAVPKPSLQFKCSESDVTFICNVKEPKGIKISWLLDEKLTKWSTNPLKKKSEEVEGSVKCNVSNNAGFKLSDPVTQNCTPKLFGLDFWLMVAIIAGGGGLVLMLIITVIVCCCRARRKKTMRVKDEEELRLGWSKPEQEHHHHHHHHGQHNHPPGHNHAHHHHQQPAGHTGPRQPRSKQHRELRGKLPEPPNGQPQPSPRRPAQAPRPVNNVDEEQPPPLPQPRKKAPKTPRV